MTTELTSQLPPCPLPDCEGGEHHFHDIDIYTAEGDKYHDCARVARSGYRCYGPHRPGLPAPISLPEITDEMVERAINTYTQASYSDEDMRDALAEFRDALLAATPQWRPIGRDRIRAGMRIRATIASGDRTSTYTGVVHHIDEGGDWRTERNWKLTGWFNPSVYEVDLATIPADPDAELIEKIGKAIHDADFSCDDAWGEDGTEDAYRKLARAALTAIRTEEREQA